MTRRPETIAAQALIGYDAKTGAVAPPIHLATTFSRDASYELIDGRHYARDDAPTPQLAEAVIAALEGGPAAMVYASGMAAATAAIRAHLTPGAHVIAPRACYFAVRAWLASFAARWGVAVDFVDTSDTAAVAAALRPGVTRLVWIETPANPTLEVSDIAAIAELAHAAGARLCVDSTAATPVHAHPLALGADLVMHSATKFLAGHSDVLAGALVTAREDAVWTDLHVMRREEGPCLSPHAAFLLLRGMRTLFARVPQQSATALALATRLGELPGASVRYPGLAAHPQHALAARQMTGGFGGLVALQTGGGAARALAVIQRLRVWVRATSLGGVESLVEHRATVEGPDSPTPPDLLRLSCGLEHVEDLYEDLAEALRA